MKWISDEIIVPFLAGLFIWKFIHAIDQARQTGFLYILVLMSIALKVFHEKEVKKGKLSIGLMILFYIVISIGTTLEIIKNESFIFWFVTVGFLISMFFTVWIYFEQQMVNINTEWRNLLAGLSFILFSMTDDSYVITWSLKYQENHKIVSYMRGGVIFILILMVIAKYFINSKNDFKKSN